MRGQLSACLSRFQNWNSECVPRAPSGGLEQTPKAVDEEHEALSHVRTGIKYPGTRPGRQGRRAWMIDGNGAG